MITIVGMIHNVKTDRWHPVIFRDAPMPGPNGYALGRVRSHGHHTTGFATRAEAEANVECHGHLQGVPFDRYCVYEWDGEGIPALTGIATGGNLILFNVGIEVEAR